MDCGALVCSLGHLGFTLADGKGNQLATACASYQYAWRCCQSRDIARRERPAIGDFRLGPTESNGG